MLNVFTENRKKVVDAALTLLELHELKVTRTTLRNLMHDHPDFPSLLCISDVFKEVGFNNIVVQIGEKKLNELPTPFITYNDYKKSVEPSTKKGEFWVITNIDDKHIKYRTSRGREKVVDRETFLTYWSGIVLIGEVGKFAGEPDYLEKRKKERIRFWLLPGFIMLYAGLLTFSSIKAIEIMDSTRISSYFVLTLLLKTFGLLVSVLLVWYEIDNNNLVLQKVCGGNKKINCQAVLHSKKAKLLSWLSWSEIGLFYFAGGLILLLLPNDNYLKNIDFLVGLSILAFPYILFSIYYQWKVVKQWCSLCLAVQTVLLLEVANAIGSGRNLHLLYSSVDNLNYLQILLAYALPVLFWYALKQNLKNEKQGEYLGRQLNRLKYNPTVFNSLLKEQKKLANHPQGLGITLGPSNAKHTILKICNPYCGPCAKAHLKIENLLEQLDNIKVQIIFLASNQEGDKRALPAKHLLAVAKQGNETLLAQALHDWYAANVKDYNTFANKYPLNGELNRQIDQIEAMYNWCKETKIAFTPTYFLDGFQFPRSYELKDLKIFLGR